MLLLFEFLCIYRTLKSKKLGGNIFYAIFVQKSLHMLVCMYNKKKNLYYKTPIILIAHVDLKVTY